MNDIKRFISKVFKIIVLLTFCLTLNVTTVKAESTYTDDNIFYAVGSFINSTQKGISRRLNELDLVNLGKNYVQTLLDNGSRMSDIVRIRGKEILFNPYGKTNIGNFIDSVYGTYKDFADYAVSKVETDRYILNIDKTYTTHYDRTLNDKKIGFMVVWGTGKVDPDLLRSHLDYHTVDAERVTKYNSYAIHADINSAVNQDMNVYKRYNYMTYDTESKSTVTNGVYGHSFNHQTLGVGVGVNRDSVDSTNRVANVKVHRVVFSNDVYESDAELVPYNREDIPTKQEFEVNITNVYKQGKFYSYNFDQILNETTVINNTYIINNYTDIEEVIPVDDDDDDVVIPDDVIPDDNDNTSLLEKILASIKALPDAIIDKLDIPEGSDSEGGGFWSGLFGAIGDLVSGMSDFLTSIPGLFIELFDGLLGLVEKVVELFVPSAEQVEELKNSLQLLVDDLTGKFDFVLEPVNQIKNVYSQPKSIYDLTIEYDEQVIHVVPSFLKSSLDKLKVLLNGSVVLFTFISIYKRFVGREDVIK